MKPARGEYPYITRQIRRLERNEPILFREFRGGIVIKLTPPHKWTQVHYGQHRVTEDMVEHRPRVAEATT
jgi:hypothetical protein